MARTIEGRLLGVTGRGPTAGATVWLSGTTVSGDEVDERTTTDDQGEFSLSLPSAAMASARVGAQVEGAATVDLEPGGEILEPGEVVIVVDDIVPSHLRNAG